MANEDSQPRMIINRFKHFGEELLTNDYFSGSHTHTTIECSDAGSRCPNPCSFALQMPLCYRTIISCRSGLALVNDWVSFPFMKQQRLCAMLLKAGRVQAQKRLRHLLQRLYPPRRCILVRLSAKAQCAKQERSEEF